MAGAGRAVKAIHPHNASVVLRVREAQAPVVEEYTQYDSHGLLGKTSVVENEEGVVFPFSHLNTIPMQRVTR
jgi:hypothetical protein